MKKFGTMAILLALALAVASCTCGGKSDGLCEYDVISGQGKVIDHFRRSCRPSFSKDGVYYKNLSAGK